MKISIVGAGNAGCLTALHYSYYLQNEGIENAEIELVYDPTVLPERVGQATLLTPLTLLWGVNGFNWYDNNINATMKSGILYEGWGKKNEKIYHSFPPSSMAMHYCPSEMQKSILDSGLFKVIEDEIDPKDVDADYVFDCRGKPEDFSDYIELKNPTNACILAKPNWDTTKALWSRHVATPDGWTFVIPTHSFSPSHDYCVGYCYNSDITSREDAEKNCLELFDVEITKHTNYKNYIAKNPVIDDRIILNGNKLFFLEPMESSSTEGYLTWARWTYDAIIKRKRSLGEVEKCIRKYIDQLQNFILWHYQAGSKYDTPFWKYAKQFKFKDPEFNLMLKGSRKAEKFYQVFRDEYATKQYAQWHTYSFKNWDDGIGFL